MVIFHGAVALGLGAYRGSDSIGLEIKYPFNPAAFSPCLLNPNPDLPDLASDARDLSSFPLHMLETNVGVAWDTTGRTSTPATCVGSALLACSRHEVMDRLDLEDSRKMRPTKMLTQPMENRKKAATRVKVST